MRCHNGQYVRFESLHKAEEMSEDSIWQHIRDEVTRHANQEPTLSGFLNSTILKQASLEDAVSVHLSNKLQTSTLSADLLRTFMDQAFAADPCIGKAVRADIQAVCDRDPATNEFSIPLLFHKGLHAIESHRFSHWLWNAGRRPLALYLQNRISEVFNVDIHPAARLGQGIMVDHGTSVVIGETAVIEDNVSMLHEVTLGGTGKQVGDRHPKVRRGVLIGAGAKILGNVEIGEGAKIGAGSVVLMDVPAHCTVAGVPATLVGCPDSDSPALDMNHGLPCGED